MYKTRSNILQRWSRIDTPQKEKRRRKNEQKFNAWRNRAEKIRVGMIVKCYVDKILDYGVVVNIRGLKGFLHISEISNNWIKHPSDVLELGQKLRLKVISKDVDENGRCSIKLSKKAINYKTKRPKKSKTSKKKRFAYMWELKEALKDMGIKFSENDSYEILNTLYQNELNKRLKK